MATLMSMMACGIIAAVLAFVNYINGRVIEGIFLLIFSLIAFQWACFVKLSDIYDTLKQHNYMDR